MYQTFKMHAKHPIWGNETIFPEMCLFSYYKHVRHQSAKKHGYHPVREYKTLRKTGFLSAFQLLTKQNAKRYGKLPSSRKKITSRKTCYEEKTLKCMTRTLYGETRRHYERRVLLLFYQLLRYEKAKKYIKWYSCVFSFWYQEAQKYL